MNTFYKTIKNFTFFKDIQLVSLFFAVFFIGLSFFLNDISLFWSSHTTQSSNISLMVDVSKSMEAFDVSYNGQYTSRIDLVKWTIQKMISEFPNHAYALSIFAWESQRILPFTTDKDIFATFLSGISYKDISKQGTNIVAALRDGLWAFTSDIPWWALVVFTDGWDENMSTSELASLRDALETKHIELFIVGVWTKEGAYIPTGRDAFWEVTYKMYQWQRVVTKLSSENLRTLASQLNGTYKEISNSSEISSLLSKLKNVKIPSWEREINNSNGEESWISLLCIAIAFFFFLVFLTFYIFPYRVWVKK